jgi:hypothetical protein
LRFPSPIDVADRGSVRSPFKWLLVPIHTNLRRIQVLHVAGRLFALLLCFAVIGCSGSSANVAPPQSTGALLKCSTTTFDLGEIPQGGRTERTFTVTNPGTTAVEIASTTSSCECTTLTLERKSFEPGASVQAKLTLDLGQEKDFVGGLGPTVTAKDESGRVLLEISVSVDVRRTPGAAGDQKPSPKR